MSDIIINGGTRLKGECFINGAKNALLPVLAACMLTTGDVMLYNCPSLSDTDNMIEILRELNCHIVRDGSKIKVNSASADSYVVPTQLANKLRSSVFMLGPLTARMKKAVCPYPGGCNIGARPVDMHISALRTLGVEIVETGGNMECECSQIVGKHIQLDYPSVGATENVMMAAVCACGETVIHNAAREPEIEELARFLNLLGYNVRGAGNSDIYISGSMERISDKSIDFEIISDRIVTGTIMCAAAVTRGDIILHNVRAEHIYPVISKLCEAGCKITQDEKTLRIISSNRLNAVKRIETMPYPAFPTDMQSQMAALLCTCKGTSVIVENVFENRFMQLGELSKMGADIVIKGRTAIINGVERLSGCRVNACDLRGGAALVIAALGASGTTIISKAEYIDRGYERIDEMLGALGAYIVRA